MVLSNVTGSIFEIMMPHQVWKRAQNVVKRTFGPNKPFIRKVCVLMPASCFTMARITSMMNAPYELGE